MDGNILDFKRQAYSGPRDSTSYQRFELSLRELDELPELLIFPILSGKNERTYIPNIKIKNLKFTNLHKNPVMAKNGVWSKDYKCNKYIGFNKKKFRILGVIDLSRDESADYNYFSHFLLILCLMLTI